MQEKMTLDEIREYFKRDKFATNCLGAQVDSFEEDPYRAQVSMTIDNDKHLNGHGFLMGGVTMSLCDFALAVCSNTGQIPSASVDHHMEIMNRCKGERLIAKAECAKNGHTLSFYEINVYDELGTHIGRMTATTMRTGKVNM